ncbi:MAG: NAD(P)/FAD-dependent oxidoreductase [Acidimicrobiales bacterium]
MPTPHIVVIGGGFAGVWAAAAAAAAKTATAPAPRITMVTPSTNLSVRPRLYEADLAPTVVDLRPVLEPLGVRLRIASATHLDPVDCRIETDAGEGLAFDAAVLATGSSTPFPPVDGLADHAHRIDVHHHAAAFRSALADARRRGDAVRVTVVGGGLTGIELAAGLASEPDIDVTLLDGGAVGEPFGPAAMEIVRGALSDLGVKIVDGGRVAAVDTAAARLAAGGSVDHDLLVWCGGLVANGLAGLDAFERDHLGRLVVDPTLRLSGPAPVWAAGDAARFRPDGVHVAPMSCQFAIPSGRLAGFNAAAAVVGLEPVPLDIDRYVTCIDLGRAGALFTRGWDRAPVLMAEDGKRMKTFLNRTAIYPPTDPTAFLAEARPDLPARWG